MRKLLPFVLLGAFTARAEAHQCAHVPIEQRLKSARAVFGGRIAAIDKRAKDPARCKADPATCTFEHSYRIDVDRVWSGAVAAKVVVEIPIDDAFGGAPQFKAGDDVIFVLRLDAPLRVTPCDGSASSTQLSAVATRTLGAPRKP